MEVTLEDIKKVVDEHTNTFIQVKEDLLHHQEQDMVVQKEIKETLNTVKETLVSILDEQKRYNDLISQGKGISKFIGAVIGLGGLGGLVDLFYHIFGKK